MKATKKNRKAFNIVLAIVLAIGLWLYVVDVENPTGSAHLRDLPVQIQGEELLEENGLMVTDLSDKQMDVKVNGKKKTFMKLHKKNIALTVDVSTITGAGVWTLTCKLDFPPNVNADSISVADWNGLKVMVTVQRKESREVPIRGEFVGTESEHCLAGHVETEPSTVKLTGPAPNLAGVSYALAQVEGENIHDTLVDTVPLILMGSDGTPADVEHITCDINEVKVTVPVRKVVSVPLTVELECGTQTGRFESKIQPKSVTLVAKEDHADLPASISLGKLNISQFSGTATYAMPIHLPPSVTGWGTPSFAKVEVSAKDSETKAVAVEDIVLKNVPKGIPADLVSQTVFVWVQGDSQRIKSVQAEDILVEADLSQLRPSKKLQRIPVQVSLKNPADQEVQIVGSRYTVALRLTQ